jgi:hypothetical protein
VLVKLVIVVGFHNFLFERHQQTKIDVAANKRRQCMKWIIDLRGAHEYQNHQFFAWLFGWNSSFPEYTNHQQKLASDDFIRFACMCVLIFPFWFLFSTNQILFQLFFLSRVGELLIADFGFAILANARDTFFFVAGFTSEKNHCWHNAVV